MPTWESLPLLLSQPDAYMRPAHLEGHVSEGSRELMLGSCSGQLPFPRVAGVEGGCGTAPVWSSSLPLRRSPSPARPWSGPAVPTAHLSCAAPPRRHCAHSSTQHVLPGTKGGHGPVTPSTAPLGDESHEETPPLAYSSGCLSPPLCPAPPAHHRRQPSAPPRGREGDKSEGGSCVGLNYCHEDVFFNLYPLQ